MATTTGIKLDATTRDRLRLVAERKDRSPHWLMKRAIAEYLDREERHEREKREDLRRWRRYQESGAFIDHDDMRERLTLLADSAQGKQTKSP